MIDPAAMAQRGEHNEALGLGLAASTFAEALSYAILLLLVVPISDFVLKLSSPEMLIVGLWGLTLIAALRGRHYARGLLAGALGLLAGTIGFSARGDIRGTMGIDHLLDGIPEIPAMMGLFCAAELFNLMRADYIVERAEARSVSLRRILDGVRQTFGYPRILVRGSLIDAIQASPGKLSTGVTFGSAGQISTMLLLDALGIPAAAVRIVTYDGGGPLRTALAGGHLDFSVVQAEGSETIRDFVRPLAVFREDRAKDWDAPPINEALKASGVAIPILSGSIRVLAASAAFKKKQPQAFDRLVLANRRALENPEYRSWLAANKIDGDWLGPEKTTAVLNANFEILKKYRHLLKN